MDKSQEEQQVEKKIGQLQNQQKILLNRKRSEERRERTHRLIGRGAILEAVFPAVVEMEGEEVKAFLIALSRLPGAAELAEKTQNARDEGVVRSENGALIHRSGVVRPAGGCCALRARWGAALPNPLAPPPESDTRCASVTFRRGQYPTLEGGAFLRQFFTVQSKSSSGARASPPWPLPHIGAAKNW